MVEAQTQAPVVLKKYGNRRLYDTSSSRYVTIGEVEAMVQSGKDILVKDAKSGDDITKEILVQLLLERDSARAALPTGLLQQAVRLANSPLKDNLVKAVQDGLDTFMQSQRAVVDAQRALTTQLVSPWLQAATKTPAAVWNPFQPPAPPPLSGAGAPVVPVAAPAASDVDVLRAELAQTQALVQQLLQRELGRDRADGAPARPAKKAGRKKAAAAKKKA
jgi:polyhydroxyalkanoate synthesis repressor PhaR